MSKKEICRYIFRIKDERSATYFWEVRLVTLNSLFQTTIYGVNYSVLPTNLEQRREIIWSVAICLFYYVGKVWRNSFSTDVQEMSEHFHKMNLRRAIKIRMSIVTCNQ